MIVPSFTFVSTADRLRAARRQIVFADIRPDTLNLDERQLDDARHRADARDRAGPLRRRRLRDGRDPRGRRARHGLAIVSRTTRTVCFGRYRGRPLGTFGVLAAQSFHETKNFTCGEGGALAHQRPDARRAAPRSSARRERTEAVLPRQVDKYTWVDLGSSYVLSDLLAAFLVRAARGSATRSSGAREAGLGRYARAPRRAGPRRSARRCRSSRTTASSPTTCSTSCCRRSTSGSA